MNILQVVSQATPDQVNPVRIGLSDFQSWIGIAAIAESLKKVLQGSKNRLCNSCRQQLPPETGLTLPVVILMRLIRQPSAGQALCGNGLVNRLTGRHS